jgi:polysaccharide pyruvyl transferase CsaB
MSGSISITGHFGFGNLGDEAILNGMLRDLRSVRRDLTFKVISGDPVRTRVQFDVESVHWTDISALIDAIRDSELVILGGGGLFHDYWGCDPTTILSSDHHGLSYYAGIPLLAFLLNKPLMLYAVGIGPLLSVDAVRLTEMSVGLASRVTLRDRYSRDYLAKKIDSQASSSTGFDIVADPAVSILPAGRIKSSEIWKEMSLPKGKHMLGVALRRWGKCGTDNDWENEIAAALDTAIEGNGFHVLMLCFQRSSNDEHDDVIFAEHIRGLLRHPDSCTIVNEYYAPSEMLDLVGCCSLMLGMRLHSVHFAIKAGVPVVAIAYDPKVRELMRSANLENECLSMRQLREEEILGGLRRAVKDQDPERLIQISNRMAQDSSIASEAAIGLLGSIPVFNDHAVRIAQDLLLQKLTVDEGIGALLREKNNKINVLSEKDRLSTKRIMGLQEQITGLDESLMKVNGENRDLTQTLSETQDELKSIHSSRHWKVMSVYWRAMQVGEGLLHSFGRLSGSLYRGINRLLGRQGNVGSYYRSQAEGAPHLDIIPAWPKELPQTSKVDIIFFPVIEWDFRFQRPHHLARQFAQHGHRVFYLSPRFESKETISWREVERGVFEIRIPGSSNISIYQDLPSTNEIARIEENLAQFGRLTGINEAVCVVQLPFWRPLVERMRSRLGWHYIYDCMDEHSGFETNSQMMIAEEKRLIEESNLVLATSSALVEKCSRLTERILHVPNAVEESFITKNMATLPILTEMEGIPHPIIGYIGAISAWFDFDLIRKSAHAHPEWSFVLVGSEWGSDPHSDLHRMDNIHFLGEQPYERVAVLIANFDVCLIPFKLNELTLATDPVKLYEYLAFGKPVVASNLPELPDDECLVRRAASAEDFRHAIEEAIEEENHQLQKLRREFASHNTWENRYLTIQSTMSSIFLKVSLVIPTWNNLKLTQDFVRGLFRTTSYPNLEILFIDNGSEDGTDQYLQQLAEQDSRVHVIQNQENLGFPAAVNQGLESATGEYLLILNNDVIPTSGWLSKLMRVLRQDPSVGLVGPVSNSVGNEAKVDLQYRSTVEMESAAFEHARRFVGEVLPIPMLAMFCVAGRKEVFDEVGPLDERFGIGMFEDDDYAIRVRKAGYRVVCARDVFVHHAGSASFNQLDRAGYTENFDRNRKLFEDKWAIRWDRHVHRGLDQISANFVELEQILVKHSSASRVVLIIDGVDSLSKQIGASSEFIEDLERKKYLTIIVRRGTREQAIRKEGNHLFIANIPQVVYELIKSPIVYGLHNWPELITSLRSPEIIDIDPELF